MLNTPPETPSRIDSSRQPGSPDSAFTVVAATIYTIYGHEIPVMLRVNAHRPEADAPGSPRMIPEQFLWPSAIDGVVTFVLQQGELRLAATSLIGIKFGQPENIGISTDKVGV